MAEGRPDSTGPDDWAVDGRGNKLAFPDGTLISGLAIERAVRASGRRLTNAEAAQVIIEADNFATGVAQRIAELRSGNADHAQFVSLNFSTIEL